MVLFKFKKKKEFLVVKQQISGKLISWKEGEK